MSVIHNNQRPESTLRKNISSVCYNTVRESVAMGESLTRNVGPNKHCAELATKVLYVVKRRFRVKNLLYDIYDDL